MLPGNPEGNLRVFVGNPAASKPRSGAHSRIGGLRGAVFVYFLRGPRGPQADLELAHVAEVGLEPLVHLPAPSQILEITSLRHRVELMSRLWLPPKMMFGRLLWIRCSCCLAGF